MEKSQIVTIAVTTAISTTVALLVTSVFSAAKARALESTNKQRVKRIFTISNIFMVWCIGWLIWSVVSLRALLIVKTPPTRVDVFTIGLNLLSITFYLVVLGVMVGAAVARRHAKLLDFIRRLAGNVAASDH